MSTAIHVESLISLKDQSKISPRWQPKHHSLTTIFKTIQQWLKILPLKGQSAFYHHSYKTRNIFTRNFNNTDLLISEKTIKKLASRNSKILRISFKRHRLWPHTSTSVTKCLWRHFRPRFACHSVKGSVHSKRPHFGS